MHRNNLKFEIIYTISDKVKSIILSSYLNTKNIHIRQLSYNRINLSLTECPLTLHSLMNRGVGVGRKST